MGNVLVHTDDGRIRPLEHFYGFTIQECIRRGFLSAGSTVMPHIKKVIFNPPATIVLWSDGTKTVVKCQNEAFDREKGLAMAIAKKALGNRSNFNNEFKKWIDYDEEKDKAERLTLFEIGRQLGELLGGAKNE